MLLGTIYVLSQVGSMHEAWPLYQQRLLRAVAICAVMVLVAWGLIKYARWAWWIAVLSSSFGLIAGLFTLGLTRFMHAANDPIIAWSTVIWFVRTLTVIMALALVSLLLPSSRAVFRRRAAA
jgi:hypothetical protein